VSLPILWVEYILHQVPETKAILLKGFQDLLENFSMSCLFHFPCSCLDPCCFCLLAFLQLFKGSLMLDTAFLNVLHCFFRSRTSQGLLRLGPLDGTSSIDALSEEPQHSVLSLVSSKMSESSQSEPSLSSSSYSTTSELESGNSSGNSFVRRLKWLLE